MTIEFTEAKEQKTIYTYNYLYQSAKLSFQQAIDNKYGRLYNYINSIVMAAFTLEAYLNHCGAELVPFWENIEKIKIQDKLNVICHLFELKIDKSKRPFQTMYDLIKIRNLFAHGRTETISAESDTGPIQTKWESKCNKKDVGKFLTDLEVVIRQIHKKAFDDQNPFLILATGFAG
jgi:hypothetical protein